MTKPTGDQWASGAAYEAYMGRWSRAVARGFIEWLRPKAGGHWLDVGCGTGALTSTIGELAAPASVIGCDQAEPFIAHARTAIADPRVSFVVAGAGFLPSRESGFDAIVSGLVLNFLPDPALAVAAMRTRLSAEGVIAAYVWDYASGLEFLRLFWDEAKASDSAAASLDEGERFPLCAAPALASLFRTAGLADVETTALEIPTPFVDFDDYWAPFLAGTGPAPSYVASLEPSARERLREGLRRRLGAKGDGLRLRARAWAVRGRS